MIFSLIRKSVISIVILLAMLAYLGGYGILRLSGQLVHYKPIPLVEPSHRIQAAPPDAQNVVENAVKSTTRLTDLTRIGDALKQSYQKQEQKGHWLDTLYYPLRKVEEVIWNSLE